MNTFGQFETTAILLIIILVVWDLVWKIISLWKSARRDQLVWFIILAIINSAGYLTNYLFTHT
jgi:Kef-type K+ transport system membrane component KefB